MSETDMTKARAPEYLPMKAGICSIEAGGLQGMITLRADLSSLKLEVALKLMDMEVPGIRTIHRDGERGIAWMSPDELLIFVPYGDVAATVEKLEAELAGEHFLAVDVSDARARFVLEGAGASDVLQKGMPVDFSDGAFPVDLFRRSRLETVVAAVGRTGPERYELICFRSYGDYVWRWLHKAADVPLGV